jgi:hypothetical protein
MTGSELSFAVKPLIYFRKLKSYNRKERKENFRKGRQEIGLTHYQISGKVDQA